MSDLHAPARAREGWRRPGLLPVLALVGAGGVLLSLLGQAWDGWAGLPVALRFAAGLTAFGIAPGVLVAVLLVRRPSRQLDPIEWFVSVFTCSFSCNLVFNLVLFAVDVSFARLTTWYLVLQALGFAAWGLVAWRELPRAAADVPAGPAPAASGAARAVAAVLLLGAVALVYAGYTNGAPLVNAEELVSLRKLASNPVVSYDNISFRNGDPSTYLFVPFQVLIVGTSLLSRLDVALIYSLFWAVTTALSLVVLTRLAYVMLARTEAVAAACLLMVGLGVFDLPSVVNQAGIVAP